MLQVYVSEVRVREEHGRQVSPVASADGVHRTDRSEVSFSGG